MPKTDQMKWPKIPSECKHLNFTFPGYYGMGRGVCLDCGQEGWIADFFNGLAAEMLAVLRQMEERLK